jgi:two-component system, NtrC family, response regulator AtoC
MVDSGMVDRNNTPMQTPKNGHTILVGEDEMEVRGYLDMALKCLGYAVELAQDGDEVLACLQASGGEISAILLDNSMPNRSGMEILGEIQEMAPGLPVIMVSAAFSPVDVVMAMKNGATDFLGKPVTLDDLRETIGRALEMTARDRDQVVVRGKTETVTGSYVGRNPRMHEIHALVGQIGWSEAPVLIQGETGSGKEVLARELHARSPRASKLFVKLNCAALPSELVESELFGYERGAFTGAFQKKAGMFEVADGGTILLDEIGDMDVRLQAKLLQVLQDHEFQRIGGKATIKVDVRVMAATHCDLEKAIVDRTFREDLYYRLNVINVHLPPLRERPEDIIPLAEFIFRKHTPPNTPAVPITGKLKDAMMAHRWPGNVRELENVVRRLIVLRDADLVSRELTAKANRKLLRPTAVTGSPEVPQEIEAAPILAQVTKAKHRAETEAILAALQATHWNRKQAAMLLEIDYKALLYKMKKLGVEDDSARDSNAMTAASGSF